MPPPDLSTVLHLPRLVELLLQRGLPEQAIQQILGISFLAALERLHA